MLSPNNHSEYFPRYPVHYLKANILPHFSNYRTHYIFTCYTNEKLKFSGWLHSYEVEKEPWS